MATSLPSVVIPSNTWVDLYSETGIVVGTRLVVQNIGSADAILSESAAQPVSTTGHNIIIPRSYLTNASAAVGAWAFSDSGTTLQVEEA